GGAKSPIRIRAPLDRRTRIVPIAAGVLCHYEFRVLSLSNALFVVAHCVLVPVLLGRSEVGIGHADLLSLVVVGCAPGGQGQRGEGLRAFSPEPAIVAEVGYNPGAVVVREE